MNFDLFLFPLCTAIKLTSMLRLTLGQVPHRLPPHAIRGFAAAAPLQNKASRSGRKVKWTPQSAPRATPVAGTPTPGQAGTDIGQGGAGLFEGEAPPAAEASIPTPEQIEKEMLDAQPELQAKEHTQERPNLAGTDVAQGGAPETDSKAQAGEQAKSANYGREFCCMGRTRSTLTDWTRNPRRSGGGDLHVDADLQPRRHALALPRHVHLFLQHRRFRSRRSRALR